jgi:iron-sulfur cluster repair protein YtfE (RIC family)
MTQRPIQAEQTVGEVAHHHAGALEIMKRMGINHGCGAQLTRAEAAAAAGVPVKTLIEALNTHQSQLA